MKDILQAILGWIVIVGACCAIVAAPYLVIKGIDRLDLPDQPEAVSVDPGPGVMICDQDQQIRALVDLVTLLHNTNTDQRAELERTGSIIRQLVQHIQFLQDQLDAVLGPPEIVDPDEEDLEPSTIEV